VVLGEVAGAGDPNLDLLRETLGPCWFRWRRTEKERGDADGVGEGEEQALVSWWLIGCLMVTHEGMERRNLAEDYWLVLCLARGEG